jgi:prepilin signal peptidase PulO-like enzyme (type II secretory pathway)
VGLPSGRPDRRDRRRRPLAAAVAIVVLIAARRITLKSYVPYGPFLILGALWAMLATRPV